MLRVRKIISEYFIVFGLKVSNEASFGERNTLMPIEVFVLNYLFVDANRMCGVFFFAYRAYVPGMHGRHGCHVCNGTQRKPDFAIRALLRIDPLKGVVLA